MTVSLPIALAVGDVRGYCVLSNHCHIQILDVSHDSLNGFVSGLPFSSLPPPSPIGRPDTQAIRILALLQTKTLPETKNRTLKCLKRHYSTVRSMKNAAVLTGDGAFALFFSLHPGGFDSSRVPTLGNLPSKAKKMLFPGGQPGKGRLGGTGND